MNTNSSLIIEVSKGNTTAIIPNVETYDELINKVKEVFNEEVPETFYLCFNNKKAGDFVVGNDKEFSDAKSLSNGVMNMSIITEEDLYGDKKDFENAATIKVFEKNKGIMNSLYELDTQSSSSGNSEDDLNYQAQFYDYNKVFEGYQGETIKVTITVENNGTCKWPKDTALYRMNEDNLTKIMDVKLLSPRDSTVLNFDVKIPYNAMDKYITSFCLCYKDKVKFGEIYKIFIKIKPIVMKPNIPEVEEAIKTYKNSLIMIRLNIPKEYQENMSKLLNIFVKLSFETIYEALSTAKNNFGKAVQILYKNH